MSAVDELRTAGQIYRDKRKAADEARVALHNTIRIQGQRLMKAQEMNESQIARVTGLSRGTVRNALGKTKDSKTQ